MLALLTWGYCEILVQKSMNNGFQGKQSSSDATGKLFKRMIKL